MMTIEYDLPPCVTITYTKDGITVKVISKSTTVKEGDDAPPPNQPQSH